MSGTLSFLSQGNPIPPQPTGSDTATSFPLWLQQYTANLASAANNVASQPYTQYPGTQVAQPSADTQAAWNLTNQNLGSYNPSLWRANELTNQGGAPIQTPSPITANQIQAPSQISAGTINAPNAISSPWIQAPNEIRASQIQAPGAITSPNIQANQIYAPNAITTPTIQSPDAITADNVSAQAISAADINKYLNPYQDQVIGALRQQANSNFFDDILPVLQDKFVSAGQSRSPQEMQATNNALYKHSTALDNAIANSLAAGYTGALNTAVQQQGFLTNLGQQQQGFQTGLSERQQAQNLGLTQQQQGLQTALAQQQQGFRTGVEQQQQGFQTGLQQQQQGFQTGLAERQQAQNLGLTQQQQALQLALAQQQQGFRTGIDQQQQGFQTGLAERQQAQNLGLEQQQQALRTALAQQQQTQNLALSQQQQGFLSNLGLQNQQNALTVADRNRTAAQTAGAQFGQLGALQQQLGAADVGQLAASGQAQDTTNQANINAALNNFYAQQQWPYQNLGFASNVVRGLPVNTNQQVVGQTYNGAYTASPLSQFIGTTIGASALGLKHGGRVSGALSQWRKVA